MVTDSVTLVVVVVVEVIDPEVKFGVTVCATAGETRSARERSSHLMVSA